MKRILAAIGLLASLTLAACVVPVDTGGEAAPAPGEVAFELAGPGGAALVVPVRVNDAGPFPFVLDTGATVTCVDQELATELGLRESTGTVGLGGSIAGVGRMRVLALESVALGDAVVRDLRGCAVDLSAMRAVGLDVRGLLGLNFLKEYTLTVDFQARRVRLDRPETIATR